MGRSPKPVRFNRGQADSLYETGCGAVLKSMDDAGLPEDLRALLASIRGQGYPYGPGMRMHPASSDEGDRAKHGACLERERRGLVGRRIDGPDLVSWIPKVAADGDATRDRARPG